jgi:hypothetical protein
VNETRKPGEGLTDRREVLTDEYIEWCGERFTRLRIRAYTGARFEEYVAHPEATEAHADFVRIHGVGILEMAYGAQR